MCHIVRDLFFAILYVCPCIVIQQRLNDGFFKKIILKYPAVQIPYIILNNNNNDKVHGYI